MRKGWIIILVVVLIFAVLGGLCVGVGIITGADGGRILTVLDNRYHVTVYLEYISEQLLPALQNAGVV